MKPYEMVVVMLDSVKIAGPLLSLHHGCFPVESISAPSMALRKGPVIFRLALTRSCISAYSLFQCYVNGCPGESFLCASQRKCTIFLHLHDTWATLFTINKVHVILNHPSRIGWSVTSNEADHLLSPGH